MMDLCPWEAPKYIFFSSNIPSLLYYSHVPAIVLVLILAFLIFYKNRKSLDGQLLILVMLFFATWNIIDIILWATNRPDVTIFFWSIQILVEVFVYFFSFYLSYVYSTKIDFSLRIKILFSILLFPFIVLVASKNNLLGVDLSTCYAIENFVAIQYTYFLELFFTLCLIIVLGKEFFGQYLNLERRKEIFYFFIGIVLFLISFASGNIVGSITSDWEISQYGLVGMPIFIAFLTYIIVRFKAFNIKLIGAQALVIATIILIGSQFFFIQNPTNKILNSITLVLVMIFGWFLIKSVKKEVAQKEKLEKMSEELKLANLRLQEVDRQKTEFLSIASHQLRTPLSILKGYIELIQDGAFGKITSKTKEILKEMDTSNERLVKLIDEFLDITRIEEGRNKFSFSESSLNDLIDSTVKELVERAKDKGLKLVWERRNEVKDVYMDEEKIRHVVFNYIDNAIKYSSEQGDIKIEVEKQGNRVLVKVKDSGLGFGEEDEANFFQKFYRGKNVKNTNVTGTGIGLFVCRKFIESHGGRVWAHSAGLGKGSEFGFWIPIKKLNN